MDKQPLPKDLWNIVMDYKYGKTNLNFKYVIQELNGFIGELSFIGENTHFIRLLLLIINIRK